MSHPQRDPRLRDERDLPEPSAASDAPHAEDLALARACIGGSGAAWAELVERFESSVYFALRNAFRSHGREADESTLSELQAEVLFRVVRDDFARLRSYSGRCSLKHWLKVVASNFVVDSLRKRGPVASLDDPAMAPVAEGLVDATPASDELMERRDTLVLLRELWDELPDEDRTFVRLHYEEELDAEAVAAAMHTTVGAIYSRKTRVTRKLRSLWRRRTCTEPSALRRIS